MQHPTRVSLLCHPISKHLKTLSFALISSHRASDKKTADVMGFASMETDPRKLAIWASAHGHSRESSTEVRSFNLYYSRPLKPERNLPSRRPLTNGGNAKRSSIAPSPCGSCSHKPHAGPRQRVRGRRFPQRKESMVGTRAGKRRT